MITIHLLVVQIWFDIFSCETLVKFHCIQLCVTENIHFLAAERRRQNRSRRSATTSLLFSFAT